MLFLFYLISSKIEKVMIEIFKTIILAMMPIGELRASIPVALFSYGLPAWQSFIFSVLGNMIPVFFLLLFLKPVTELLSKVSFIKKFLNWFFDKTERNHKEKFLKFKEIALVILVAIPLPFTGAWTASVAALLFKIPFWKAVLLIFLGVIIAGVLVLLTSLGILKLL
jgi:uncharacterized membrane protein